MIFYIASEAYHEVIRTTVEKCGLLILRQEVSNEFYILKNFKQRLTTMSGVEQLIIDLSALKDTDDEIIQAIENYRMMYDTTRIIILATNRRSGDELLARLFQLGLYNLVLTDDFLRIRDELQVCLTVGKTFKDAIVFKDSDASGGIIVKQEIKQVVNKVFIGIAGSQKRIGVTHTAISLAAVLRNRGYMVALAEYNLSGDFERIRESFEEELLENDFFSINGIDYYPSRTETTLAAILGKSYNFVIADFGAYTECDQVTFSKTNVRLLVAGSRAWEMEHIQHVFELCPEEMLMKMSFLFPMTYAEHQQDIRESMKTSKREELPVYFPKYEPYPYHVTEISGIEEILKEYLPAVPEQKKGFLRRKRKVK